MGWQAPNTLGRRLAEQEQSVRIFGETYHRRAEVVTIGGFSAHAGQQLLAEYALRVKGLAQKVFLVHGEAKPAAALSDILRTAGLAALSYPDLHSSVEL